MARLARSLAAALCVASLAPLAIAAAPPVALAQTQPTNGQDAAPAQVALTEAQIQAYLAAQGEIEAVLAKQPEDASDKPDPKVAAQLDAIAKKFKFASYDDYSAVEENIGLAFDGVDPQTKKYVGADALLKQQIADLQADKGMAPADKKQALAEMNDALKSIEPVKFPGNIDLVLKYYDKIAEASGRSDQK